jgi:hypothetical protein
VLSFLANTDEIGEAMQTLQNVFSGSFHKGDGAVPNVTNELASLHYAALSAWSLLLTVIDLDTVEDLPLVFFFSMIMLLF